MTDHQQQTCENEATLGENTAANDATGNERLCKALLQKAAEAQVTLVSARNVGDAAMATEELLRLRASALLLASVPCPDLDATRFRVLAASLLAQEDDDASSLARRMIEAAITMENRRLLGPPLTEAVELN